MELVIPAVLKLPYVKNVILFNDDDNFKNDKILTWRKFLKNHENGNFDVENFLEKPVDCNQQTALIFMSSGTTGLSKAVEISQKNVIANITINHERIPLVKAALGINRTLR